MLRQVLARFGGSQAAVRKLLIAAMALGFAALIAVAIGAGWLANQNARHTAAVAHTYQVELAVNRARIAIEQTETTRRGYLLARQPIYLAAYRQFNLAPPRELATLRRLTIDNPGQQARLAMLRDRIGELTLYRERSIALVQAGQGDAAVASFVDETGARRLRQIRDTFDAMTAEEQRLLVIRDSDLARNVAQFFWLLGLAAVLLALVAVTTLLTVLRYTRDLDRTSARLTDLNDHLEDEVRLRTADLVRANEEVQRFAYIVSHDLRSPLVNVMGFTAELDATTKIIGKLIDRVKVDAPQLATDEAEQAAREDLPEAIGFIRASTAKMDRLINAILKLSREGRRVLSPEPIDMTGLVGGIRDSLIHLAEERGVEIAIEPLPAITSDRVAIEQIFSNLVENATKYLEPGRPGRVVVRGEREGSRALFAVSDNGRGIAPSDHARIFDLFRRSGRQDTPGEGIGLAHARALAIRLGGIVSVESALGEGATFRVSLPVNFEESGEIPV